MQLEKILNPETNRFEPDFTILTDRQIEKISGFILNEDGETYTVTINDPESEAKEMAAILATVQFTAAKGLLDTSIPIERIEEFAKVFDYPVPGKTYVLDWILRNPEDNELYRVVQPTVTWEKQWVMSKIPAIVTPLRPQKSAWVQPSGAHDAYKIADIVTHKDKTWESLNANNVWEPGVFGWKEI